LSHFPSVPLPVEPLTMAPEPAFRRRDDYYHQAFYAHGGDQVRIWLDRPANVLLLDRRNYALYAYGYDFYYLGGYAQVSPVILAPLYPGFWHLVVDLGCVSGQIGVRVELLSRGLW
jgi:hypothetical protein